MTLENLFAQSVQEDAFLLLGLCGLGLGAWLHVLSGLRRGMPVLSWLWDALFAAALALVLLGVMLRYGGGLRLYGLLGITVGLLVYQAGLRTLAQWLAGKIAGAVRRQKKKWRQRQEKAGNPTAGANTTSKESQGA